MTPPDVSTQPIASCTAKLDPALCRELARTLRSGPLAPIGRDWPAIADQLTAASELAQRHAKEISLAQEVAAEREERLVEVGRERDEAELKLAQRTLTEERVREVVKAVAESAIDGCYYDDRLAARAIKVHGVTSPGCVKSVANAIADRAAKELAGSVVDDQRDAEFVALRKALHARIAEVQLLHPVAVAANAWRDDPCKGLGSHKEADLVAAVDYYRAQPAAALPEQLKPTTASIGPEDAAIIDRALGVYSSDYNDAPHERIAAIRALLSGPAPGQEGS